MSSIDQLVAQLEELKKNPPKDVESQKKLYNAMRDLSFTIEHPVDTTFRILYSSQMIHMGHIGVDLKLFEILSNEDKPHTVEELSKRIGAEDILLARLLRFYAAHGMVKEVSKDTFAASNITHTLADPGTAAGIKHDSWSNTRAYARAPEFFEATAYRNPTNGRDTPMQLSHNTKLHLFDWFKQNKHVFDVFNRWMAAQRHEKTWLDVTNVDSYLKGTSADTPLLVDVGGGHGHQSKIFRDRYPNLAGRVILQDLQRVVDTAQEVSGVEKMGHDFWKPQPVKGSRIYYMRNVMHDHADQTASIILKHTIEACGPDSVIVIDDAYLPDTGVNWKATESDMIMMHMGAAVERTVSQWDALFKSAGLTIKEVHPYTEMGEAAIVTVPIKR